MRRSGAGRAWQATAALIGVLGWGVGWAQPQIQVFVRADCGACRQQLRALSMLGLKPRARDVDREPAAKVEVGRRLATLGLSDSPERLPTVAVGAATLPDDPAVADVLRLLPRPPPRWRPPGGEARVQRFGRGGCAGVEASLRAAGLRWESSDPLVPAVAERMWVQLRLLGHQPRHGVNLPVWIVGDRVLQGCPTAGSLAHALPVGAVVRWARAERDVDPKAFAARALRVLSTVRDRPRLGLKRLLHEPGLLGEAAPLAGQLRLATRRRPLRPRPWGSLDGPVLRVIDPWAPGDATVRLLQASPLAWWPGPLLGAARLTEDAGVTVLEVQLQPEEAPRPGQLR